LPEFGYYKPGRSLSRQIRPHIEKIKDTEWRELYRCRKCGIYWRIDKAGRFQTRFAWKIPEFRNDWSEVEHIDKIEALMLTKRGGTADEKCSWLGCENPRVKSGSGSVYCVHHLYATGARE
jgi:hypothetical protein